VEKSFILSFLMAAIAAVYAAKNYAACCGLMPLFLRPCAAAFSGIIRETRGAGKTNPRPPSGLAGVCM
jgi:hypothetical protein